MARPRFILNTSLACDANQLTFRRLAEFWDVPHFTVDVPYAPSEESVAQVAEQLRAMAAFVQAHGGAPWRRTRCGPRWPAPGPPWRATTATCPCGRSAPSLTR